MKELKDIEHFVFDLDNTLYQGQTRVFEQVSKKMGHYISSKLNVDLKKAKEIQRDYFHTYNTTLNGMMVKHNINPEEFLEYVHDIDISFLKKDKILREELVKLKGKKYIMSNGSHSHIKNVCKHLGVDDLFNGAFDITDSNFVPKPLIDPYNKMIKKFNIDPKKSLIIEDLASNLEQPKKLGFLTVWLRNDEFWGKKNSDKNYIDLKIDNLSSFLKEINILQAA